MPKLTSNKPTPEELKAKEEEAIKAAEELEGRQQIPPDDEEVETPDDDGTQPELPVTPEPSKPAPQVDPSKELYKKKFSESAKENQKIYAKNRVLNKALIDADEIPEPTEEELIKEFSEWDVMSDTEKTFARETVISRSWRARIKEAQDQAKKIEKWNDAVQEFVGNPQVLVENPELEGKTEEFGEFATEEANNNVPFKILVSAFLHDHSTNKKPNKGAMFPIGSGGPNEKPTPKSDKITLEEARKLRETDYNKWKEYLKAGKIESDL